VGDETGTQKGKLSTAALIPKNIMTKKYNQPIKHKNFLKKYLNIKII
jgi:hypothetical protein